LITGAVESAELERARVEEVEANTRALLGDEDFAGVFEHERSLLTDDAAAVVFAVTTDA
jgi:hypothetical protein